MNVSMWSDGGPKHFKTCRSLLFVCNEIKAIAHLGRLEWNFFASNHGKGMCDSQTANAKRRLKKLARAGTDTVGVSAIAEVVGHLRNTTATVLPLFDRTEAFNVAKEAGTVREWHCFESREDGTDPVCTLHVRELTSEPNARTGLLHLRRLYVLDLHQTGASLDAAPVADRKRKVTSSSTSGISATEQLRRSLQVVGACVAVGYIAEGRTYRQYWVGRVLESKTMASDSGNVVDHILVAFDASGDTPACQEWVELDKYVRLAVEPVVDAK